MDLTKWIRFPKLKDPEMFRMWQLQIRVMLKSDGLYGYVDGSQVKPLTNYEEWEMNDARVMQLIGQSVDISVFKRIMTMETSKDMFNEIITIFKRETEQQKRLLMGKFLQFKLDGSKPIAENIATLTNITVKLKALNSELSDNLILMKLLNELPDNLRHFFTEWENASFTEWTLEDFLARLTEVEANSSVEKNAKTCYTCGRAGHISRNCPTPRQTFPPCRVCKRTNHRERDCFFLDKGKNEKKRAEIKYYRFVVATAAVTHVMRSRNGLTNIRKKSQTFFVGGGKNVTSEEIGDLVLGSCTLQNIAICPEITHNLLSVSKIAKAGGSVMFNQKEVIIKKGEMVLRGNKDEAGLFQILMK